MVKQIWIKFWGWYERHRWLNILLAAGLFGLQLIHLYWLSVEVVLPRLTEVSGLWPAWPWLKALILLVDYTEIPAIISTSLVYINEIRRGSKKAWLFLFMLNSQWLHIFWITDEFVVSELTGNGEGTVLPGWAAWAAIAIDYLEVPVIIDLFYKLIKAVKQGNFKEEFKEEFVTFRED